MKEMELHESEEESLRNMLDNYLIMSKQWIKQIKANIEMFKDAGLADESLDKMRENLKQAKENHKKSKQAVQYWKQKINNSDDITEVYIE